MQFSLGFQVYMRCCQLSEWPMRGKQSCNDNEKRLMGVCGLREALTQLNSPVRS